MYDDSLYLFSIPLQGRSLDDLRAWSKAKKWKFIVFFK